VGRRGYRFIGEVREDTPVTQAKPANRPSRKLGHLRLAANWTFIAAAAIFLTASLFAIAIFRAEPPPITRFTMVIPSAQIIEAGAYQSVAISPTANHLAYIANGRVYLRARASAEARPIAGTEDQGPLLGVLFSPDSKWIGFYSSRHRELRKVPLSGGIPVRIASADGYLGGSWSANGTIVFAQADGIFAVSDSGGEVEHLVTVDREQGELVQNPVLLPGRRAVVFTLTTDGGAQRSVAAQALQPGSRRVLIADGTDGRYMDTGHLVFADAGTLMVAPLDLASLRITAPPLPVAQRVREQSVVRSSDFVVSQNGALVYRTIPRPSRMLVWLARDGGREPEGAPSLPYGYAARVSPDGGKIAVTVDDEDSELFVWDMASQTFTRLTFNPGPDWSPVWTPDSRRIMFASGSGVGTSILSKSANGTGAVELLLDSGAEVSVPNALERHAGQLVYRRPTFVSASGTQDNDLWVLALDGTPAAKPLLATEHQELNADISPDGRWLAYQSNETGRFEIYVRPFPQVGDGRWQVSTSGGVQPLWSPSGDELYYLSSGRLLSAPIAAGETLSIGLSSVVLDTLPYVPYERSGRSYDIAPDGERFLFVSTAATISDNPAEGADRYEVVLNWAEELKRLVPLR
jgi:serine/threonine-protein kinase